MHTTFQGTATDWAAKLPVLCSCSATPTLIKEFLESSFYQWAKPAPSNWNSAAISSFAYLLTKQSNSITTNQIVQILIPHLHRNGHIRGMGWELCL